MFFLSKKKFREEVEREAARVIEKKEQQFHLDQNFWTFRKDIEQLSKRMDTLETKLERKVDGARNRHVCGAMENGHCDGCDDCILPY